MSSERKQKRKNNRIKRRSLRLERTGTKGILIRAMAWLVFVYVVFGMVVLAGVLTLSDVKIELQYPDDCNANWSVMYGDDETLHPVLFPFEIRLEPNRELTLVNYNIPYESSDSILLFHTDDLMVKAKDGLDTFYSYGPIIGDAFVETVPSVWNFVELSDDLKSDRLEIVLKSGNLPAKCTFEGFKIGTRAKCLIFVARSGIWEFVLSALLLVCAIILFAVWIVFLNIHERRQGVLSFSIFVFLIGLTTFAQSGYGQFFYGNSYISWYMATITGFVFPLLLLHIIYNFTPIKRGKNLITVTFVIYSLIVMALLFSQLMGLADIEDYRNVPILFMYICIIYAVFFVIVKKTRVIEDVAQKGSLIIISLGLLAETVLVVFDIGRFPGVALTIASISEAVLWITALLKKHLQQNIEKKLVEKELENQKLNMMVKQIKPHFIYNTLAAIRAQIAISPDDARKTILDFSKYLRANIDSITDTQTVPFSKELENVKTYISLEQTRFIGKLNVEYDIEDDNFDIPPLTLQPIVENSVVHGIRKQEEPGTIRISVKLLDSGHLVKIVDDGVGFDIEESSSADDASAKAGLNNVQVRLSILSNATLDVFSECGKGTTVEIFVPFEEE